MNRSRDKEEMATDSLASVNTMDISGHCARLLPFALGVYPRPESLHHVGTLCPAFRSRWMALQEADLLYIPVSDALGTPSATWMLGTALGSSVKAACALLTTTVSLAPSHLFLLCFHFHSSKTIWEAEAQLVECFPSTKSCVWPQGMCRKSVIPALRKWRQEDQKLKVILSYRINLRLTWAT